MRRYLINGRVLTMAPVEGGNKKTGKKQEYRNGFIGIEDGKIVQMGEMEELGKVPLKDGQTDVIDAGGRLIMPGIIEAHCHMGITEEKKGMEEIGRAHV